MTTTTAATAEQPTKQPAEDAVSTLTAADRCDRCGAQAYVVARFPAADLLFCAHHAHAHRDRIADHVVLDNTHLLSGENRQKGKDY